jgi:hypothetical protein
MNCSQPATKRTNKQPEMTRANTSISADGQSRKYIAAAPPAAASASSINTGETNQSQQPETTARQNPKK